MGEWWEDDSWRTRSSQKREEMCVFVVNSISISETGAVLVTPVLSWKEMGT